MEKNDGRRVRRAEKELHLIISKHLASNYRGEFPGLLSIHRVQMPGDLRSARVFVSVLNGSKEDEKTAVKLLNQMAPELQARVAREMPMKYTPKLFFERDESLDHQLRIDQLLHDVAKSTTKKG